MSIHKFAFPTTINFGPGGLVINLKTAKALGITLPRGDAASGGSGDRMTASRMLKWPHEIVRCQKPAQVQVCVCRLPKQRSGVCAPRRHCGSFRWPDRPGRGPQALRAGQGIVGKRVMPRPSVALVGHRDRVLEIAREYGASNVRIFGSAARGTDREGSDIDLLVDMDDRATLFTLAGFEQALRNLLGVRVDVRTPSEISRYIRDKVLAEARPL